MANDLAYLGGGLLSGIGKGLVADAAGKAAREAARADLEAELARDVRKRDWGREDADLKHQRSQSEVTRTETDAEGNTFGITRGGEKVDLKIKGMPGGGKTGQDPARVKEANWLVKNGIYPDLATAYEATRERVGMNDEDKRKAAITWAADQKNEFGEPLYDTPEKLAGAVSSYQKLLEGDSEGFVRSLKKVNPDEAPKPEQQAKGFFESLFSNDESAVAATPAPGRDLPGPADAAGSAGAQPQGDGTEASPFRPSTQEQFDALPTGAIFINPKDGKPYRKK
jgi:hypothetical protein